MLVPESTSVPPSNEDQGVNIPVDETAISHHTFIKFLESLNLIKIPLQPVAALYSWVHNRSDSK